MLTRFALKNILAYRKRSVITCILITISTALLVFSSAFMDGSHSTMVRNAVEIYPGYIQITGHDYRNAPGLDKLIESLSEVEEKLARIDGIETFGARFETFVLLAGEEKSAGALFTGIEPTKEAHLSRLKTSLVAGNFLEEDSGPALYIGSVLAKKLKVEVGDVLSFIGTGADYSFAADNLKVHGIFKTGLYEFDGSSTFVTKKYFDSIMLADEMATHVIVLPRIPEMAENLAAEIATILPSGFETLSWQQSMSALLQAMELDSIFGYITLAVIFIVIFFVIMIYTLLSVFTRIREIGVLRAIGTQPGQICRLLLTESFILSLVGVFIGGLIGGCISYYFQQNPIMPAGYEEQFKQYGLVQSAIPALFSPPAILRDMIIMFVLAVGSTLYPILRVLGYNPVEAMHHV